MATLDGVKVVRAPKVYPLVKPVDTQVAILAASGDPEWGVAKIGAPAAWDAGVLGQGVVVANVDTGVEYTHPALVGNYRGNNGDGTFTHDYNWWDPSGICGDEPCDNVGHGTHTMGTIAGGDGPGPFTPDIGVAPGARWIAAKGCEDMGCSETALLSSGQFILAPTDLAGDNPDPSRRARRRQQLVGRRPQRPVLPRDRPGLACVRDHPGLLVRQPGRRLRRRRLARRLPGGDLRGCHRLGRRDRRLLRPRPVRRGRQGLEPGYRGTRRGRGVQRPGRRLRGSTRARRWPRPTRPARSR